MRLLKFMLPLLVLLLWGTTAKAQYDPVSPPEPGVYFTLTTQCTPSEAGYAIYGGGRHAFGSNVGIRIYTTSGYRFLHWEDDEGTVVSTTAEFDYVMPAKDVNLTARFVYDPDSPDEPSTPEFKDVSFIDVKMNPEEGGYMYEGAVKEYEVGTTHTFRVSSNPNYRFVNWTRNGIEIGTSPTLEFTVPIGDQTLVANFAYDPNSPGEPSVPNIQRNLTVKTNPEGAGITWGTGSHDVGSEFSVAISTNTYYHFKNWTDEEGNIVADTYSFVYTMPDRHVTLTANCDYIYDPSSPGEPGTPNPDSGMAENMVLWPRMGMYDDTHVQILCETPGATIHYTLDGSTPTAASPVYTAPVFVPSNLLVRAIAYKEGMEDSPVVSYQVTAYKTATPVFTFENLKLNITSATPDAIIRYTTDFTDPTEESDIFTAPFLPEENCRIKAYASKDGLTDSPINIFVFRRADYTIPAPAFNINDDGKLEIIPSVSGGQTWYTTDGTVPTTASTLYTEPLELDGNYIIKAYTTHTNFFDSPIGEYASEGFIVEKPTYSFENPLLTLSTATEGASIRYTLDGTIPTEESTLYTAPIRLTADSRIVAKGFKDLYASSDTVVFNYVYKNFQLPTPTAEFANRQLTLSCEKADAKIYYAAGDTLSMPEYTLYESPVALTEDCTVRFYASLEHFNDSEVGSFDFKVANYQVAAPVLTYDPEALTVTMACETENAQIRYTRDGSIPTATTGTLYEGPAQVVCNQTFTAVAFRSDMFASEPASVVVDDQKVPTPTASFANKVLTLACSNPEAQIRYTIDGTQPSAQSTLYSEPVALNADCTVLFYASCENFNDSEVATYEFKVADHQVAAPVLTYDPEALTVTMACPTEDVEIRYAIDGETPTESTGMKYEGPVAVVGNHTYTAKAFRSDLFASDAASVTVDDQQVPTPTANFANRVLTLSCPDENAQIRYTLDGTDPTSASSLYVDPVALTQDCTVKIIAQREYFIDSEVATFEFKVADHQVALPGFGYDAENSMLTISCATENAEIRYTSDGTDPTATNGIKYEGPIKVEGNSTYKARAFRSDLLDSKIASLVINDQAVATPTASFANKLLTLSCEDANATIRYTLDGTNPTSGSALYNAPLALTSDCIVKFIAQRENYNDSEVAAFQFKVADYQVEKPVFVYNTEAGTVTITCGTENAEIRYALDGSVPTLTTGTKYTGAFTVASNLTVNAKAFRSDLFDSETASLVINDKQVPTPTASFANKQLTLACADSQATIYYTTNGTDPTTSSAVYTAPIALTSNCTVKFFATRENYNDSEVGLFQFTVEDYMVATPVLTYNPIDSSLSISCATENAEIRFTTDGSEPTATNGTRYTAPVTYYGNVTFNARAFRTGLFDSEVASLVISGQKVATPTASFASKQLTLSCSDDRAAIRYTLDGSEPTASSTLYSAPVPLTADCTVRFIATRENFNNSDVATFVFRVADYRAAAPVITHSLETLKVTMTSATAGATIRYSTDGTEPTATTGTVYAAPVDLTGNMTFTARAFHNDYFDSDVTVYEVSDMKLPKPTASYGKHAVTLTCEDNTAQIRYTTDNTAPTATSALYTAPIAMSADCTVRFIATKTGFVSSDEGSYKFVLADWQEAMPTITKDFAGRKITISQANSLPVNVTIDGTLQNVQTPATLDVTPGMTDVTAVAIAQDENRYDSPAMTDEIVFHMVPAITYDGHTLRVALANGEPAAAAAERQLFIDDRLTANGTADLSTEIDNFCYVTARVQSEKAFISDPAEMRIDVYNTGRVAAARNGHRLAEAFSTWGDKADSYEYLRLGGELSRADIDVVAALPQLKTLHMEVDALAAEDYAGALAGTGIETIFSNEYPEGLLTGMPRLTTLMWGRTDRAIPDGRVKEAGNPNLLFWTPNLNMLPEDASNTVAYEYAPAGIPTDPAGIGVSGRAEEIHLYDGYPFQAHMPVTTGHIDFKKIFRLPTEIDICAGWETIVLPFTAETISHERQGAILPFAAWDGQNDPYGGIKPFWLYRSSEAGWEEAGSIEAGVPYIISMPNNKEYVESSNLNGEVTFLADGEILLGTKESAPKTTPWKDGAEFTGIFMPLEETGVLSMNVNAKEGEYAGSAFTADATTLPFGAYVWAPGAPQAIPVFTDGSGIQRPTVSTDGGMMVETPAPGMMRISSSRALHTAIFTPEGATVRVIDLQAGEALEVDGLTRGLYIVGGVKVMVR